MNISDLNVGDMVTVREWDDMVSEYGVKTDILPYEDDPIEYIEGPDGWWFNSTMKRYCGNTYAITDIYRDDDCIHLENTDFYGFTSWMLCDMDASAEECVDATDEVWLGVLMT